MATSSELVTFSLASGSAVVSGDQLRRTPLFRLESGSIFKCT
jgi:hypothetical protein